MISASRKICLKKLAATLDHPEETQARVQAAQHLIKKHYTMDAMGRDVIRIYRLHQVKIERRFFRGILKTHNSAPARLTCHLCRQFQ